ncbi:helix-turn-helix domain-containing protein [Streptomyces albireticuli]|uniref:HTH cro/C1-type domain-containing protein n=2 Tax=Streptomyces albireticuli TaxID=1940 RepID=A0A2A2D8L8_9ACTN|nr:hypothetical protein CK936_16885 [Streptomyces albireticuli]
MCITVFSLRWITRPTLLEWEGGMYLRSQDRFEELVRLKGMSQRTLADRAHVTQAFISLVAHGRRGVRPETAWRIASALGVLTDELFTKCLPDSVIGNSATRSPNANSAIRSQPSGESCVPNNLDGGNSLAC